MYHVAVKAKLTHRRKGTVCKCNESVLKGTNVEKKAFATLWTLQILEHFTDFLDGTQHETPDATYRTARKIKKF